MQTLAEQIISVLMDWRIPLFEPDKKDAKLVQILRKLNLILNSVRIRVFMWCDVMSHLIRRMLRHIYSVAFRLMIISKHQLILDRFTFSFRRKK